MNQNELYHHGILGMKWGVRRYQNKDGTLTPRGKKRYEKDLEKLKQEEALLKKRKRAQDKINKLEAKRREVEELRNQVSGKKPKVREEKQKKQSLTNEELQAKIERMKLESDYKKYVNDLNPQKKSAGKEFMSKVLVKSAEDLAPQVVKYFGAKGINKLLGEEGVYTNNKKK